MEKLIEEKHKKMENHEEETEEEIQKFDRVSKIKFNFLYFYIIE